MELGAFTLREPVPDLHEAHALTMLRPWVDVGSAGTLALGELEQALHAQPLGQLTRPGNFFDFTRYRPTGYFKEGRREVDLPNTFIHHAKTPKGQDLLFFHHLEPHARGEDYVEAVLQVLEHFSVRRYFLLGSMYDLVPHTRPLLVGGSASDPQVQTAFAKYGVSASTYQGPTTILTLLTRDAALRGIETMSLVLRLPQYAPLEEDYNGTLRLLEMVSELYGVSLDLHEMKRKADEQARQVSAAVEANPQLKRVLAQLEERYDAQLRDQATATGATEPTPLPPAIEKFLRELET